MLRVFLVLMSIFVSQVSFASYDREWTCRGYYKAKSKLKSIRLSVLIDETQKDPEKQRKVTISEGMFNRNTSATFRPIHFREVQDEVKVKLTKTRKSGAIETHNLQLFIDLENEITHDDGSVAYPAVARTDFTITPFESRPVRRAWEYPVLSCVRGKWEGAWSEEKAFMFKPLFGLKRLGPALQD